MLTRLFRTDSFRLTAIFVILMIGAMLILMALIYATMHEAFRTELLSAADNDLTSIQKGFTAEGISEAKEVISQRLFKAAATDFFVLETSDGRKLAGNLPAMKPTLGPQTLPVPAVLLDRYEREEDHQIIGKGMMLAPGLYAFAGRDTYLARATEERIVKTFGWVLLGTVIIAIGGGALLSKGFLGRMDAITQTCRYIMAGRLAERIPERGTRGEFDQLARTINAMLDRIGTLMENVQQVSNDIAHDLRTPLTRLRNQLELARSEGTSVEQYRAAVDRAISESETILSIFSGLLRIAQIEGAPPRSLEKIDLSTLLTDLVDIYQPAAEDNGHKLDATIEPQIAIEGDPTLLSQLFANLIENAMTHTSSATNIKVSLEKIDGRVVANVSDTGGGIPPAERERVFRRFYRLERSRSAPGSGLGLALVMAIARYHHANVTLEDNAPGLKVIVAFDAGSVV